MQTIDALQHNSVMKQIQLHTKKIKKNTKMNKQKTQKTDSKRIRTNKTTANSIGLTKPMTIWHKWKKRAKKCHIDGTSEYIVECRMLYPIARKNIFCSKQWSWKLRIWNVMHSNILNVYTLYTHNCLYQLEHMAQPKQPHFSLGFCCCCVSIGIFNSKNRWPKWNGMR